MHAVDIRIGGDDDLVITQSFQSVFDVQRRLQEAKFFVFIDYFFGKSERVQRLSAQAENGLQVGISAFGDGAACRIALRDEDRRLLFIIIFVVVQVNTAIAEFPASLIFSASTPIPAPISSIFCRGCVRFNISETRNELY